MLFNSYVFLLFFPIVCLMTFVLPKRGKHVWLLIASYYFYASWNATYALLMLFSTAATFVSGLLIGHFRANPTGVGEARSRVRQKWVVAGCFTVNLAILFFFKYFDFFLSNLNVGLGLAGIAPLRKPFDLLLPVGISFYTFQALSYTMDVYREQVPVERNFLRYALFVSFFPQLVAGPIERSANLLSQVQTIETRCRWNADNIHNGLKTMVVGLVLKMVVADRLAIFVDTVFAHYQELSSLALFAGAIAFAFQIYCDFNGYTLIAIGAARVLGFQLMENFNAPYLSRSVTTFWRRWHISLTTWFRDYLYFPLGGNRCSKARNAFNVMVVFLVSGLWHGASWNYIVWGALNGAFQLIGNALRPLKRKLYARTGTKTAALSFRGMQVVVTFLLIDVTWVFFRAASLRQALDYLGLMLTRLDPWNLLNASLFNYGLDANQLFIAVLGIAFVLLLDGLKRIRKETLEQALERQNLWFRWACYLLMILAIITWGCYGPSYNANNFIYFQF